jgi:uncharacterized protein involved in outer membrane biogenesis
MRRPVYIVLLAMAATLAGAIVFVALFDWSAARGPVERAFAARTGRTLSIGGAIDVRLGWPPRVIAEDVRISNPSWARRPDLLRARSVSLTLSLPSLFGGRLAVSELSLVEPVVSLEVGDEGRTWQLGRGTNRAAPLVGRVSIERGRIEYLEASTDTAITAHVGVRAERPHDGLSVRATGRLKGEPIEFRASGPAHLPLADRSTPIAVRALLRAGATRVEMDGVVAGLPRPKTLDVQFSVAGEDLSALRRLFDLNAPPTPPYRVAGRLRRDEGGWRLDDAHGRLGDSKVTGQIAFAANPRPLVTARLVAEELDFDDLGPLIGAPPGTVPGESASPAQRREARRMEASGRALPAKPFDPARLRRMDVDVVLEGKRVWHPPALPIESLTARIQINDGRVRVEPVRMRVAGGELSGTVELDARAEPMRGSATLALDGLRLQKLFPTVEAMQRARGVAHGRVVLSGRGESIAKLLASADGRVTLAVDQGRISNLVLEMLGLDAGEMVMLFAKGDREIELRCAVTDLTVHEGVATADVLVLDTEDTVVAGSGAIDLARERLDLTLYPQPKDRSIFVARSPLHVQGSFRNPNVVPDTTSLAARGATAALLGLVNPLLAVASFIETGPGKDSDCTALLARAKAWRAENASAAHRK